MMFYANTDEIREAFVEANFDQDPDEMRALFNNWLREQRDDAWADGFYERRDD